MAEVDEVIKEFLSESSENLDQVDRELVELEKNPANQELIGSIFRSIHTIKGLAGFLAFPHLEKLAHAGESLLSDLREGKLQLSVERANALLNMVDKIRRILSRIQETGAEGDEAYQEVIEVLMAQRALGEAALPDPSVPLIERLGGLETLERIVREFCDRMVLDPALRSLFETEPVETVKEQQLQFMSRIFGVLGTENIQSIPQVQRNFLKRSPSDLRLYVSHFEETLLALGVPESPLKDAVQLMKSLVRDVVNDISRAPIPRTEKTFEAEDAQSHHVAESSIRVDVGLLDKLMNQVGELVLVRNQLLQFNLGSNDSTFLGASQQLNLITSELQEGIMRTRMQPIDNIWNKFPRVVRDLAQSCGKLVRLEMKGKETDLDRTIIEAIKDPMTHLIRNAVDHGIETPEDRAAAGKVIEGCISLRAYHEGGQVNIEIVDDGGGLNAEKIRKKALQKGLLSADQITRMNEREVLNLIFLPGFSTKENVTNISGRGVGMDVVKFNIERIGGTVDIQSKLGEGTTIKLKIPLTLAIIPALMVDDGAGRYAIPQVSLLELVRLEADEAKSQVEYVHNAPVYRLRGKLLPLVYLDQVLKTVHSSGDADEGVNIVVLQADSKPFGLVVKKIYDTEEIVVKPLGLQLKSVSVFAGATILGDGKVALILDVTGLAQKARILSGVLEEKSRQQAAVKVAAEEKQENLSSLLLLQVGQDERAAVRLSDVARLEVFSKSSLEKSGDLMVIQHRDEILPLIHLNSFLQKSYHQDWADELQVVVHEDGDKKVGLVVDRILDIVQGSLALQQFSVRDGVLGTAIIQNRVTELVDMKRVARLAMTQSNSALTAKRGG